MQGEEENRRKTKNWVQYEKHCRKSNSKKEPQTVLVLKTLLSITVLSYKAPCRVPWSSVPQLRVGQLGCTTNRTTAKCLSCTEQLQQQRICYAVCNNCTGNYTAKILIGLWKTSIWNPTNFMIFQKPYSQMCARSKMAHPSFAQNLLSHYLNFCCQKSTGKRSLQRSSLKLIRKRKLTI